MTATTMPLDETPRGSPREAPPFRPMTVLASAPAPAGPGPQSAEELTALAVAAGPADPAVAADGVYAAADGSRDRLTAAAALLIERLKRRSDDFEASFALRIVERALVRAPYPDGPWRWAQDLSAHRVRGARRRRRRVVRRRRTGPRLPDRGAWRAPGQAGATEGSRRRR